MWTRTEKVLCTEKDRNVLHKYGLVYTTIVIADDVDDALSAVTNKTQEKI